MKREPTISPFPVYTEQLSEEHSALLTAFFAEFNTHCLLPRREKQRLREDLEAAILWYAAAGVPLEEALRRLAVEHLGSFYAHPPILWFPLDSAAKIYPLSMEHGRMTLFRLSVYLKSAVVPELLQMALSFTIKRFPSFATTLKKGFFWHYLDTAKRRFCIEEERHIPCQPLKVSRSGSQTFRVLYFQNRISVEFFHVLTDGTGGIVFLKALTSEYLRLMGAQAAADDPSWNVDVRPDAEEFSNEFPKHAPHGAASGFVDKPAVQMSGRLARQKPCRVLHFKMDAAALKTAAAKYSATVTTYLLALIFLAGRDAADEATGDLNIQVPVNMRKFYPSRTVCNFSMYCGIRLPLDNNFDLPTLIQTISAQLKEKACKEPMDQMLTATVKLVDTLKYIPLILKQPVAKLVYGFLGDNIFTTTLSNLGVVTMPEGWAEQIDSMDFVLGTAITNRACCAMVTFGNTATFSITKMTADPTFEEQLYHLLQTDGVAVHVEGSELLED